RAKISARYWWSHEHRWIAPDLSRVVWSGSCQKSTIEDQPWKIRMKDRTAWPRIGHILRQTGRSTERLKSGADMR
ncbi:MAG TPA: hypothetical protein VHS80_00735, partial [Chthoniobacterales bacterium]|nr:hypothetical protein [Chthoniobacterales bacterium]